MKAVFDRIEILKIQFDDQNKDVRLECKVYQGETWTESTLLISFTDLNRLLSRLSLMGIEIDFSTIEVVFLNSEEKIYEFVAQNVLDFIPSIEFFEMQDPYRQICA
jgi:hypothetical protein